MFAKDSKFKYGLAKLPSLKMHSEGLVFFFSPDNRHSHQVLSSMFIKTRGGLDLI